MIVDNAHRDYEAETSSNFEFYEGGPLLLVDADPIAYMAASACETATHHIMLNNKSIYHVEGGKTDLYYALGVKDKEEFDKVLERNPDLKYEVTKDTDDVKNMYHTIKRQVVKLIKRTKAGDVKLYLTKGDTNFRLTEEIATILKYKGNRSPDSKPEMLSKARDYLLDTLDAELCVGMEADDKLAIEHRKAWRQAVKDAKEFYLGEEPTQEDIEKKAMELSQTVLASIDKDLKQCAGKYIDPDQDLGIEEIYPLGNLSLIKNGDKKKLRFSGLKGFYAQLLMGDSCDNIPSVYFCGDTRVEEVLKDCKDEEELFKAALRETYEGFHREHIKSLDKLLNEKVEMAIESGLYGKDNKSNRTKLRKRFKDHLVANVAYTDKHYYPWWCYEENEDGTVSKDLKDGVTEKDIKAISPVDHMIEVARLVYMLDKDPCEDGSHLWQVPDPKWVEDVEKEYLEKNLMRIDTEWIL